MRFEGTIKSWNDDRGFGFIVPDKGGDEVFVHIKAFGRRNVRPAVGQHVSFEVEVGPQGKKRAKDVLTARVAGVARVTREERPANWDVVSLVAIPLLIAVYAGVAIGWGVSHLWAAAYFMVSMVTFFAYAFNLLGFVALNSPQVREFAALPSLPKSLRSSMLAIPNVVRGISLPAFVSTGVASPSCVRH